MAQALVEDVVLIPSLDGLLAKTADSAMRPVPFLDLLRPAEIPTTPAKQEPIIKERVKTHPAPPVLIMVRHNARPSPIQYRKRDQAKVPKTVDSWGVMIRNPFLSTGKKLKKRLDTEFRGEGESGQMWAFSLEKTS